MTNAEVEVPRRAVVRLVRFGFEDGERAARLLSDPDLGLWDLERNEPADPEAGPVVAALARAGDPDLALRSLHRLVEALDGTDPSRGSAAALLARVRRTPRRLDRPRRGRRRSPARLGPAEPRGAPAADAHRGRRRPRRPAVGGAP